MSRTATAEIWNELRAAKAEIERLRAALGEKYREGYDNALAEQHVEIERLRLSCKQWEADALRYCQNAADARNLAIEECAQVALMSPWRGGESIARAIRALKDKR